LEKNWSPLATAPGHGQDHLPDVATRIWVHDPFAAPDLGPSSAGGDRPSDRASLGHLPVEVLDVDRPLLVARDPHEVASSAGRRSPSPGS